MIVDADGPALVEIGARLHGGPPAHLLCRAATGTSQLDLLVSSCLDPARFLDGDIASRYAMPGAAAMALLRDDQLRGEIETLPSAQRVAWNAPAGRTPAGSGPGLATLIHHDPGIVAADLEIATGGIACDLLDRRDAIDAIAPWNGARCWSSRAATAPFAEACPGIWRRSTRGPICRRW